MFHPSPGGDSGSCLLKVLLWGGQTGASPSWSPGAEGWKVLVLCGSLVQIRDWSLVRFLVYLSHRESASEPGGLFPSLLLYR